MRIKTYKCLLAAITACLAVTSLSWAATETVKTAQSANIEELGKIVEDSEYEIRWQDHAAGFQSPNRSQNLRFTYSTDGYCPEAGS